MTDTIEINEAARWLTAMAATDGVITPSERRILLDFAIKFDLDFYELDRMTEMYADSVSEPEVEYFTASQYRGRRFEEFVVSLCSDKSRFKLLSWRSDKTSGQTYALDSLLPDLHIRHRLDADTVVEYLVECKYRSSWGEAGIDLSSQYIDTKKPPVISAWNYLSWSE